MDDELIRTAELRNWTIRVLAPIALRAAGLHEQAEPLVTLPAVPPAHAPQDPWPYLGVCESVYFAVDRRNNAEWQTRTLGARPDGGINGEQQRQTLSSPTADVHELTDCSARTSSLAPVSDLTGAPITIRGDFARAGVLCLCRRLMGPPDRPPPRVHPQPVRHPSPTGPSSPTAANHLRSSSIDRMTNHSQPTRPLSRQPGKWTRTYQAETTTMSVDQPEPPTPANPRRTTQPWFLDERGRQLTVADVIDQVADTPHTLVFKLNPDIPVFTIRDLRRWLNKTASTAGLRCASNRSGPTVYRSLATPAS